MYGEGCHSIACGLCVGSASVSAPPPQLLDLTAECCIAYNGIMNEFRGRFKSKGKLAVSASSAARLYYRLPPQRRPYAASSKAGLLPRPSQSRVSETNVHWSCIEDTLCPVVQRFDLVEL